jgi:hypothetical protein
MLTFHLQPGKYALIGAAANLGGVVRAAKPASGLLVLQLEWLGLSQQ